MVQAMQHQRRAISKMLSGNVMLVWDPGTGKTYPVLMAAQFLADPVLAIVPAHLRDQWEDQAREHAPLLNVEILDKLAQPFEWQFQDLVICSYEYASHIPRWRELRQIKWGALAIDEAHYLMCLDANRSRALLGAKMGETHGLVFAADYVWPLTGTPFTFPNQIYPILSRLFPDAIKRPARNGPGLMTAREWENEFCIVAPGDKGFGEKVVGAKNIPELRARLAPYLDKIKLEDCADMKGLTVDTIPVKGELRDLTDGLTRDELKDYFVLLEILEDDDIPHREKLAAIDESGLVMAQLRHNIAMVKIPSTIDIVRGELQSGVDKLLLLGWHRKPLETLSDRLNAPIIYGGMPSRAQKAAKDRFINDPACTVLCGQISTIGTGTDGLQAVCHRTIFHEASWAYRENKQCIHRTYRKGQRLPCHSSFTVLKGSVDEYVARVLKKNAEIVSRALD
jgi:hypothetical protein